MYRYVESHSQQGPQEETYLPCLSTGRWSGGRPTLSGIGLQEVYRGSTGGLQGVYRGSTGGGSPGVPAAATAKVIRNRALVRRVLKWMCVRPRIDSTNQGVVIFADFLRTFHEDHAPQVPITPTVAPVTSTIAPAMPTLVPVTSTLVPGGGAEGGLEVAPGSLDNFTVPQKKIREIYEVAGPSGTGGTEKGSKSPINSFKVAGAVAALATSPTQALPAAPLPVSARPLDSGNPISRLCVSVNDPPWASTGLEPINGISININAYTSYQWLRGFQALLKKRLPGYVRSLRVKLTLGVNPGVRNVNPCVRNVHSRARNVRTAGSQVGLLSTMQIKLKPQSGAPVDDADQAKAAERVQGDVDIQEPAQAPGAGAVPKS
eukprot:1196113-Prorocentrum_minimum.AAC.11